MSQVPFRAAPHSSLVPKPFHRPVWPGLTLAVMLGLAVLAACGPNPTETPKNTTPLPANLKISTVLLNVFTTYQSTPGSEEEKKKAAIQYARDTRILNSQDEAIFELELDSPAREQAVTEKIKSMGGLVRNSASMEGTVRLRVAVPIDAFINYTGSVNKDNFLADLAAFEGVKAIDLLVGRPPQGLADLPETPQAMLSLYQAVKNEGVKLMGADRWHAAGFRGQGVRIGIIDSGFKFYQRLAGTALPDGFEVKDIDAEQGGSGTVNDSVHGTAVAEIIYSLAPEAELFATSVDGSDGQIKAATDFLVSQNVHIISVSLGGHSTPGDGTSSYDRYIERIRSEKGVVFLFAAGNEGSSHYSAFFNPNEDGFHQFVPGVTSMAVGNFRNAPLETYFILNWEQWGQDKRQTLDLDLFLVDKDGRPFPNGSSQNAQAVRNPLEQIPVKLAPRSTVFVRVRQKPGTPAYTRPVRLHVFGHNSDFQFIVPQMAVADPASSKGALAVGAIQWEDVKWAYYSSQGPLPDGRFKPEISAPTGVASFAYEEEGRRVFDGTSAACPEAAGVAAILKGANPGLTADQLETLLKEAVSDLAPSGPDYANGYGQVNLTNLQPASGIRPQGKLAEIAKPDIAALQFPVLTFRRYPAPTVGPVVNSKVNPATPLPTRVVSLENGATSDSLPGSRPGATPVPASTPGATDSTPAPFSMAVFRDNFRDNASGLPNSSNSLYQEGSYRVKAGPGNLNWSVYPSSVLNVTDFAAEVTAQGIAGREGLYGLVFWQQDAANYHLLSVTGTGQYQVSQYQGGSYKEIIPWSAAPGWKAGAANNLRIVASRGNIAVSINNQPGKAGRASGQGSVGFAAGSYGAPVEAQFKDFRLSTAR